MKVQKFLRDYGDTLESRDFGNGHRGRKIRKALFRTAKNRMRREQDKLDNA